MLDRNLVLAAFREILDQLRLSEPSRRKPSPRNIAVRAHAIYCGQLHPESKEPALVTFRKFVSGKSAWPEILALLKEYDVHARSRVSLDQERVRAAFQGAIERLQMRIVKGQVCPLQVARRAYEIYSQSMSETEPKPSRLTFHSLVYDKEGDPEIRSLLSVLPRKIREPIG